MPKQNESRDVNPSLSDVLPLLNANCGDVLKVTLLGVYFPDLPKINPMWLKAPTGELEAAFAAMKAARPHEAPAEQKLGEFKKDCVADKAETRFVDPKIAELVRQNSTAKPVAAMPAGIRFDDVQIDASAVPLPLSVETAPAPTVSDLICLEAATEKFGYSYVGLANRLRKAGIMGKRVPGEGKKLFFDLAAVTAECEAKGSHRK